MCLVDKIQRSLVSRYWNWCIFPRESIAIVCDLPNYLGGTLTEARRSLKAIIFSMKYETMRSLLSFQDNILIKQLLSYRINTKLDKPYHRTRDSSRYIESIAERSSDRRSRLFRLICVAVGSYPIHVKTRTSHQRGKERRRDRTAGECGRAEEKKVAK